MKPLLAHTYEPHRVTFPCYVQPKLNGVRALYQNGNFQSRDELPFPQGLLSHLSEPLLQTFGPETILDGELYVHGWPLQRINAAVTPVRQKPTEDTLKVEYHVFDVVDFRWDFHSRYIPRTLNVLGSPIFFVDSWVVYNQQEADNRYALHVSNGYEGMMYRLGDCPYTVPKQELGQYVPNNRQWALPKSRSSFLSDKNNRCWHLLKRKDWQDDEFVCCNVVEGEGKLQGMTGAFECVTSNEGKRTTCEVRTFTVGSGLTDAERQHYWQNPPIGQKIKVKYLVLSNAGIPLNPTVLCINPK